MFRPYPGQEWFTVDDARELIVPDFIARGHLDVAVTGNAVSSVAAAIEVQRGGLRYLSAADHSPDFVQINLMLPVAREIPDADRIVITSLGADTNVFADLAPFASPLGMIMYPTPSGTPNVVNLNVPLGSLAAVPDGTYRVIWVYSLLDNTP